MSSPPLRAAGGALLLFTVVAAGAVLSPAAATGVLESIADDPYRFGLVVATLYLVRPLFAWPPTSLAIVVGYGFGVGLGVPIALAGVVLTTVPVFLATRWIGCGADRSATGGVLDRAGGAIRRYYRTTGPIRGVVVSRLAPIPSDVSTCAAAASGVRLRHLVVGTAIGEFPWTVAAVVVGASAATVRTDGLGELGVGTAVLCLAAATALLAGPVYRAGRTRSVD